MDRAKKWRRRRDSNSGYCITARRLSKALVSATHPRLHIFKRTSLAEDEGFDCYASRSATLRASPLLPSWSHREPTELLSPSSSSRLQKQAQGLICVVWRRTRDSNPRNAQTLNSFQNCRLRPLGQSSNRLSILI